MKNEFLLFRSRQLLVVLAMALLHSIAARAQDLSVKGKVTSSEDKTPIPGVSILVKGTSTGTTTDDGGNYSITVPDGNSTLIFSFIGYKTFEASISNRTTVDVTLETDTRTLEEVVVVGYGTQKKKDVTSAVASYDAKNIDERPLVRVDQALVGQMAGVTVKQTSGALGRGFSIQVRGTGSITAGSEPLYVIDGFPLAITAPNNVGNYGTGNPLDNLNPNDIESVQVLKDASAAAIYGSRASNGVVLITTKKGKSGKASISINSYTGYTEPSRNLDMLNGQEWIDRSTEIINAQWVASGVGRTADQTNTDRATILGLAPGTVNTTYMTDDRWAQPGHPGLSFIDWQNQIFRKGMVQNHQVSASGGTDVVRYYVSGNYAQQEGMVINTDYTTYSGRANVEVNASKNLKFGINIAPSYSVTNDPGVEGKDNILHQALSLSPVQLSSSGVYANVGDNVQYTWSNSINSPVGKLQNQLGVTKRFRTLSSVFVEYQIIKGLSVKTTLNLDNVDNTAKTYVPYIVQSSQATRAAQLSALTSGTYNSYRRQTFVNENTLSYSTTINHTHDVSAIAGFSYNSGKLESVSLNSQNGFNSSVVNTLSAANAITGNTTESKNVLISYFGRVQYSYRGRYLASASIRRDGSSRFGTSTQWGVFPSASVGWRISEESFMGNFTDKISDLKLRASWGKSGNYNIGDYSTIPTLQTNNYTFNGASAIGQTPGGLTNPNLGWEKSETYDVGLDVGVLSNRVTASFDYYTKLNSDLLLNVPIPAAAGFSTMLSNAGQVRNQGWEVEVTSRNLVGNLQWTTSLNFTHNTNKVVDLVGGQSQILVPTLFDIPHSILQVGQPMYSIYVVRQAGILSQSDIDNNLPRYGPEAAGDPRYVDADGNGVIDANDRVVVGHPNPDYIWGITNSFKYKGFDLTVLVQGQSGGSIYSLLGRALSRTGQGFTDNAIGLYRNRWFSESNPGDGRISKAYSTFGRIVNTDWLYSSDYVRVRNITLGYNLGSLIKSKTITGARVYLTLENFFGSDKYYGGLNPEATNTDLSGNTAYPEAGDYGGLPLPKSLIFGFNFNF